MALVIDLAIILIVALVVWRSAVHGFVRTVVELAGYILAATLAFSLAGYVADEIYERAVRPQVVSSVEQSLTDTENQVVSQQIDSIWNSLPSMVTGLAETFGVDREQIGAQLEESVQFYSGILFGVAVFSVDAVGSMDCKACQPRVSASGVIQY